MISVKKSRLKRIIAIVIVAVLIFTLLSGVATKIIYDSIFTRYDGDIQTVGYSQNGNTWDADGVFVADTDINDIDEGWSVRQLENAAALLKQSGTKLPKPEKPLHVLPAELTELETLCRETFGMRATLTGTAKKGKIVLQYYSQDELERLNEVLQMLNNA